MSAPPRARDRVVHARAERVLAALAPPSLPMSTVDLAKALSLTRPQADAAVYYARRRGWLVEGWEPPNARPPGIPPRVWKRSGGPT